ncbi:MAG: hypothetical protein AB3X44_17160 [Leptothrix sp. (in: b-proteobacteria)]
MADPLQVLSRLETLTDHYTVFEPDQVLTHGQLNGVTDYLDEQIRLSRVGLDGVGLAAGLRVAQVSGGVRITRGLGVSTDGDLMTLLADLVFDRFRPYDSTAPIYAPFYIGDSSIDGQRMLSLHELVPVGESDVLAQDLSALPVALADQAVLMLMETVVNDPDLCSGTDCDNLGRDALHRLRFLLINRADAQGLLDRAGLAPLSERAQVLPALAMRRPALGRDIGTIGVLAARYRDAAAASLQDLSAALPTLALNCPEVLQDVFAADPTSGWQASLNNLAAGQANASVAQQVWYHFVKDLIDQWNELRAALLADDSITLPSVRAFPKHLLLGALAAPLQQRSAWYPAPLDARCRQQAAHARFLARKLDTMINCFVLPTDTTTRITPSRGDDAPLEARAIPWHYRLPRLQIDVRLRRLPTTTDQPQALPVSSNGGETPIQSVWNFALSARGQEGQNLGYRAEAWASTAQAHDPLGYAIGGFDFFRIEGHLGRLVETVSDELRALIRDRNLPCRVQAVLLHNDRRLIRVKPPIRYTPLHTLHYLVRQDVALRLDEGQRFGAQYLDSLTNSVNSQQVPSNTDSGAQVIDMAKSALAAIVTAQAAAAPVLAPSTYTAYKALVQTGAGSTTGASNALSAAASTGTAGLNWKTSYASSLETISQTRVNLGHVSRADFTSPHDALISSNQPHWIDWLDGLIQAHEDRADDKLLFTQFVSDHPGLDHLGGVWRGGTFVLVYDDTGHVVGDFTLPYPAAEAETIEPVEPPLQLPPYRPPVAVAGGIRVLRPLDLRVKDLVADRVIAESDSLQKIVNEQVANIKGLVQGAFVPNNAVAKKLAAADLVTTGDTYLNFSQNDLVYQTDRVQQLQSIITQSTLPADARAQAQQDLTRAQVDLANVVANVTSRAVATQTDLSSSGGLALTQQLASSVALVQDSAAKALLNTQLSGISVVAGSSHAGLITNLRTVGRLG